MFIEVTLPRPGDGPLAVRLEDAGYIDGWAFRYACGVS